MIPGRSSKIIFLIVVSTYNLYQAEVRSLTLPQSKDTVQVLPVLGSVLLPTVDALAGLGPLIFLLLINLLPSSETGLTHSMIVSEL